MSLKRAQETAVLLTLNHTGWHKKKAAELLQISEFCLYKRYIDTFKKRGWVVH